MARTSTRERTDSEHRQASAPQEAPKDNLPTEQRRVHPLVAFKEYADERMASLETALPPHIAPGVYMSIVLTAMQKKPDLLKCTRQSLWNACIDAANCGLLPDGTEGAIAPYGLNKDGKRVAEIATFMPMIGGYRKLAYEGGLISSWEVNLVRQRDAFDFALGDDAYIEHRPYFGPEDPGSVIGAYSIAKLKDGSVLRDVMGLFELNKIKMKSKALKNGPWSDPVFEPEMHRKTMGRRHYKQLPKTPALSRLIDRENAAFDLDANTAEQIEDRRQRRIGTVSEAFDTFAAVSPEPDQVIDADDEMILDGEDAGKNASVDLDDSIPDDGDDTKPASDPEPPPRRTSSRRNASEADRQEETPPPPAEPETSTGGDDLDDRQPDPAGDPGIDHNAIRLAPGQLPENEAEFEAYVKQYSADAKSAVDLKKWWLEGEAYGLRRKLKIHRDVETTCRDIVRARTSELSK